MIFYLEKFLKARLAIELRMAREENKKSHRATGPTKMLREKTFVPSPAETAILLPRTPTNYFSG